MIPAVWVYPIFQVIFQHKAILEAVQTGERVLLPCFFLNNNKAQAYLIIFSK